MIYLDNAATSFRKPEEVYTAVAKAMRSYSANPGRSGHRLSMDAAEQVFEAREVLNDFFGGFGSEYVSFTQNCTQALNMAIKGIVNKGDHIVISCFEHNSVARPVYCLATEGVAEFSVFDVYDDENKTLQAFESSFRKNTRLCVVTAVSNVFGRILPIEKLSAIAHSKGALFFVDGAQAAGVLPLDMKKQGIDCLCVPGHKGLLGPMGTGAVLHKNLDFKPILLGGTGTASFDLNQPKAYPERLESGTLNVPGICGLRAGVEYVKRQGLDYISSVEGSLAEYAFEGLKSIKNIELYSKKFNSSFIAPVISFNVKNLHSEQVSDLLNDGGVAVRGGYHCAGLAHKYIGTQRNGAVRISPSFFNSKKDINILLNLTEKIAI